jgi:hypothetical protein
MKTVFFFLSFLGVLCDSAVSHSAELRAGFGEVDVTPELGKKPVYLAGFGHNRKATGVADPLFARAVVLSDGQQKIACAAVDVVGFFHANVESVRKQLKGFDHVVVSSTHNHEGPDTLGLWGSTAVTSGVDPEYMAKLEAGIVKAIETADAALRPVTAQIGAKKAPELLHDGREPIVKHDELVALLFTDPATKKPAGAIVQWNCHPETLADKNTRLSADFVGYAVNEVSAKFGCPVVYLTGTVGGLMTSLRVKVQDDKGGELADGTVEKTERYGRLVGRLAIDALASAKGIDLTPFQLRHREIFLPCDNKFYLLGRRIGVLTREAYLWSGDSGKAESLDGDPGSKRACMRTEIGWLRLGQLDIATIPGEIYPELVLDKVADPAPDGADFPDAPIEPAIYKQLAGPHRMIIGLANDEVGYILPKRQWDEKPPFTYGRKTAPYGEVNSLGPDTGPILCEAFRKLVSEK